MYQKSAPETIQAMFASIAENYDKANTTFSFGLHKKWNQKLIQAVGMPLTLLDLCAGTGEIGFGYLAKNPQAKAILLDFCPEMLAVAKQKGAAFTGRYSLLEGDAQELPLEDRSVDGVTISYGIRNVCEPMRCFQEVARVLRPQGRFAILELTRPRSPFLRVSHRIYLKCLLPLLGQIAAKNGEAYRYLSKSIEGFTSPQELENMLKEAGLRPIKRISLMGGLSTILVAEPEPQAHRIDDSSGKTPASI